MPVSLCEWRVRIGRFVQWMWEYEIIERKEKALKERTRLLKILHERLLKTKENSEGTEDECETKINNSSNGETDDQSGSEITNSSIPNESLRENSCPTQSTVKENNTHAESTTKNTNYKINSTFILLYFLSLLLSFFFCFLFLSDDFFNLLENFEPLLQWFHTSFSNWIWLIGIMSCASACFMFRFVKNNMEESQGTWLEILHIKTPLGSSVKESRIPTISSVKVNKAPTPSTTTGNKNSSRSVVNANKTRTEPAIKENNGNSKSTIKENNTAKNSIIKENNHENATTKSTNSENTTTSKSTMQDNTFPNQPVSKEDNTPKKFTTKMNTTPKKSSIKQNNTLKKHTCLIRESNTANKSAIIENIINRNTDPSNSTIDEISTPKKSATKEDNAQKKSSFKNNDTPTNGKQGASAAKSTTKKNIAPIKSSIKKNNTIKNCTFKVDTTSKTSTIKDNGTPTQSTFKDNITLTESTIKDNGTSTQSTIEDNGTPTQSTIKDIGTPTQSIIKDTGIHTQSTIKDNGTPTQSTTEDNDNSSQSTIKDNGNFTQSTIKQGNSTSSQSSIKESGTPTKSTNKDNSTATQFIIKENDAPTQFTIKDNDTSTQPTIRDNSTISQSTIKENGTPTPSTIKDNGTPTQSTIKDTGIPTQSTIKDNGTPTQSTIKDNNNPTQPTIKVNNTPTQSTAKDNGTHTQSTIKHNITSTQSTIKDNSTPTQSTINDNSTPTPSIIKDNITPTASTINDDTPTQSTIKKGNNTSSQSTIKENGTLTQSTIQDNGTPTLSTIKDNSTPTQSTIKDNGTPTQSTIKYIDTSTQSTIKDNSTLSRSTIEDNGTSTLSASKDSTPTQFTIKDNRTPTQSTIKDNGTLTPSTIKDNSSPTQSIVKANNTPISSTTKDNSTHMQSTFKDNCTTTQSTINDNITPTEYTLNDTGIPNHAVNKDNTHTNCHSKLINLITGFFATEKASENDIKKMNANCNEQLLMQAGDVEMNPGPLERSNDHLQERELLSLAQDVSPEYYYTLCIALGFSQALSKSILTRNLLDVPKATFEMLCEWRMKQSDGTDCRHVLDEILREVELNLLADKISKGTYYFEEGTLPASKGNGTQTLTKEQVAGCGEDFKTFYRTRLCMIKTDPIDFTTIKEFEDIYTDLVLLRNKGKTNTKTPLKYHELLTTKVNGEFPKRLVVEGEGGAGKTTLCSKIAWDWTNEVEEFQEFDWVLVIPLRDIERNQTIGDIAKAYLSDRNPIQPCQIDEYILANPSKVFIIFDGLDEYTGDLFKEGGDIARIVRHEKYKECRVLVTTRPWKADQIKSNTNFVKSYAFIAVTGFDEEHISTYINKYFTHDPQASGELIRLLESNDVIKENMAKFPIYIAMLCVLWQDSDGKKRELIRRLKTFSQLFQEIITFLTDHYVSKQFTDLQKENLTQTRKNLDIYFTQIGQISLSGLMDKKLVFAKNDFSSCEVALETCFRVGVLSLEYQTVHELDRHKNVTHPVTATSVFFTHKLFQEYLAGVYLASLFESDPKSYKVKIDELFQRGIEEFRYLLYFTASETRMIALDITNRLMSISKNYEGYINILVDVTYEAYDEDVAKAVGHNTFAQQNSLEISDQMSAHTVSGYLFIMEKQAMIQKVFLEGLNVESIDPSASRDLARFLCLQPCLTDLTIRNTGYPPLYLHNDFYQEMAELAPHSKIQKVLLEGLDLESNDWTSSRDLARFLCLQPCLTDLTIRNTGYPPLYLHNDFYHEMAELAPHSKIQKVLLESLDLESNDWTSSGDLARFLCLQPCLTDLTIRNTGYPPLYLHDDFYHEMAELAPHSKIQKVLLEGLNLESNDRIASRDLARFLCRQPFLTDLTIRNTDELPVYVHDDFYEEIADLASNSKVQKVLLEGFDLESNDLTTSSKLAEFLCFQPCLTDLTIRNSGYPRLYFHGDFYRKIAELAPHSKIQKVLLEGLDLETNEPTASRDLARFLCLQPCLTELTIRKSEDVPVYVHKDFYYEMACLAPKSKIQKVSLEHLNLERNGPIASRDLARFLCLQPYLADLKILWKTDDLPVYLHDDFYHEIALLTVDSKIQKLLLEGLNLESNDRTASRDLARFLCLQPCLTDLTIKRTDDVPVYLHDDFYHEIAHVARNSKIQKVWLEGFDLGRNDREASRDLARFLCLQPCLTDLTIRSTGYPPVYFHDDFYHEMAELAPHSKIQKVSLACFDLKSNDRMASRDLARFLCLQPCLTDLTIRNTLHQPVYVHDDFYLNIAEFARLSKIQRMLLEYFDPKTIDWNTSRYLARFLCLQPCLTDLTISDTHDQPLYLHDDFYQACLEVAHLAHDPAGNFFTNKLRSEELKQMDLTQKPIDPSSSTKPMHDVEEESQRDRIIRLDEHNITIHIPQHESHTMKEITVEALQSAPSELVLKKDEAIISMGLKFSPPGLQCNLPIKITMPHSAIFTHPKKASIFFCTRRNDADSYSAIPSSEYATPRCEVRQRDLDLYIDHFSDWWIIAKIRSFFYGKRLICTPYVPVLRPRNMKHCIYMCLTDDNKGPKESIKGYEAAFPTTEYFLQWGSGKLSITYFLDEQQLSSKSVEEREFYRLTNHRIPFILKPGDSSPDVIVKFTLSQDITKDIMFKVTFHDVGPSTFSSSVQTEELGRNDPAGQAHASSSQSREYSNLVKASDLSYVTGNVMIGKQTYHIRQVRGENISSDSESDTTHEEEAATRRNRPRRRSQRLEDESADIPEGPPRKRKTKTNRKTPSP